MDYDKRVCGEVRNLLHMSVAQWWCVASDQFLWIMMKGFVVKWETYYTWVWHSDDM